MIVASAPGKLMLAGEYAVAERLSPALAVATDLRVEVRVTPGGEGIRVSAPALGLSEVPPARTPVVAAAILACGFAGPASLHIQSQLGSGPDKPGLGASAALTVAVMGALREAMGAGPLELHDAIAAHRSLQDGLGSGYDVATALHGGLVRFDPADGRALTLAWPAGLHAVVLSTGRGASTTAMLKRLDAARRRDPAGVGRQLGAHARASRALVAAFESGDAHAVLRAAAAAEQSLDTLDRSAGVGIASGGQAELRRAIEAAGAVARTSGAGGGDSTWALALDEAVAERAAQRAGQLGYGRLAAGFPGEGLRVSAEGDA
ncbi:MAG: hypothetical protein H6744_19245 [Deltaproteobacteria bacterium]|nr:hypothetical protein [Deltaproteobacteria bacterium]MCB9788820.1 hypothetical protein [Deltaproteobacteria bacterium]